MIQYIIYIKEIQLFLWFSDKKTKGNTKKYLNYSSKGTPFILFGVLKNKGEMLMNLLLAINCFSETTSKAFHIVLIICAIFAGICIIKETEGYIRVVAGAGSGKTRVLTHRYVYIAKALGVPTEHILSVTFTNKAANVMKKRIRDFMPDEDGGYIGTFHSICRKILSFDIHKLNYPKNFKILDVEDQKELLRVIYEKYGLKLRNSTFSNVLDKIELYKYNLKYIPDLTSPKSVDVFPNLNVENKTSTDFIINEYPKEQRKNFYLDFADLIYFTLYLLKTDKEFNEKWSNHFEYIQVDEFQDVSAEQYELVSLLSKNNENLFIVGDPDQTIYSFRGANVNFFLDFDKKFKDVKTIILDTNYRSTPQILSASNSLITKNAKRIDKQLKPVKSSGLSVEYHHAKTRKDECDYIAKAIADIVKNGGSLNDCAVLYRNNNNSRAIRDVFLYTVFRITFCT